MNIRRGSSPFHHCWTAKWQTPPMGCRVRNLTRAIQRADVLPIELRRTLSEPTPHHHWPTPLPTDPRRTLTEPRRTLTEPRPTLTDPRCILTEPRHTLLRTVHQGTQFQNSMRCYVERNHFLRTIVQGNLENCPRNYLDFVSKTC